MYEFKFFKHDSTYKGYYLFRTFSFLLKIVLVNLISIKNAINLNDYISEIHIVIKGKGNQAILSNDFNIDPSEVIVNGIAKGYRCKKTCDLNKYINNVTIIFDKQIKSCYKMFHHLENIIEIDLSNFDASEVINMEYMFGYCKMLKKIKFGSINTSSVENLRALFFYCEKLISIDFSIFDTSKVNNMESMFYKCTNLEKINFGNINTSSVENMHSLFFCCEKLISINLSNFDTSKVKDMKYMFAYCKNLKYLDLSNFDTSNVNNMERIFFTCESLIYLNLNSFHLRNSVNMDSFFGFISSYVKICANDEKIKNKLLQYTQNRKSSNCSHICFKSNIKIDINKKQCIESCLNNGYNYELNNICYNECPKDSFLLSDNELNNNNFEDVKKCYDKTPEGYYFNIYNKYIVNSKYFAF